ncbi:MBL fold metallo-hydrolase [Colwellia psychrerythraea]|uniref:Beta-lactamase domain protein n=1 Tax=Colwellia psychrerythraea TaxID=28229 RepID=A0A099L4I5_COLPS|nr:MBL fold metallo-hydrolase [Colwellia psychrerythraea]KGJ97360.1 beta-lactamase domain protein [Colwellia psychrerythraea]
MKLHHLDGHIQTILLAEYPDRLLLLDGCCRSDISLLKHFITDSLQRPFNDLTLVVVTHMHPDHAGAANKLRKITGCKIATANVNGQWYSGLDGRLMHLTDMFLTKWVAKRMKRPRRKIWYSSQLIADYKLDDGESLPGFPEWIVLSTQGHTDRDLSLHHLPSNKVYVADLMVKVRNKFIPPFPIFYPNRYRASLHKIIALQPDSIILAHGGEVNLSVKDYQQLLQLAPKIPRTHWRSVKAKLLKLFKK